MGGAIGATGNVDAMAEALAKYKEVKAELVTTPPPSKVFYMLISRNGWTMGTSLGPL